MNHNIIARVGMVATNQYKMMEIFLTPSTAIFSLPNAPTRQTHDGNRYSLNYIANPNLRGQITVNIRMGPTGAGQ